MLIFICVLAQMLNDSHPVPTPVQLDGKTHGRVAFIRGLPNFKPLSRFIFADSFSAKIAVPDTLGAVYVCMGRDSEGSRRIIVFNTRRDSISQIGKVPVQQLGGDTLFGTKALDLLPSGVFSFPLDMRIIPNQNELVYRWALAKEDPLIPGGMPVPHPLPIQVGKPFPKFTVDLLGGGRRNLATTHGRICVINWWGTVCAPCIAEMPGLNTLVKQYKGRVDFVAVNPDPVSEVRAFLAKRTFSYQQALADTSGYAIFGSSVPRNIVLDKSGTVIFYEAGGTVDTFKKIDAVIQSQLSE